MTTHTTLIITIQSGDQDSADRLAWSVAGLVNAEFGADVRRADEDTRASPYDMTFEGWEQVEQAAAEDVSAAATDNGADAVRSPRKKSGPGRAANSPGPTPEAPEVQQ